MTMFSLIEVPKLFMKTVLGFESDGDNVRGLSLTTSIQDQFGSGSVSVVPGSFD
jgi:hypothetical protein